MSVFVMIGYLDKAGAFELMKGSTGLVEGEWARPAKRSFDLRCGLGPIAPEIVLENFSEHREADASSQ